MGVFARPRWYGVPVLVHGNLRILWWSLAIIFVLAALATLAAAGLTDLSDDAPRFLLQVFVASFVLLAFGIGWFVAVFFFFRMFVNVLRMGFHRSDRAPYWSRKMLYVPFYGFRAVDLDAEGLRYRKLAGEGLVGFLLVFALMWLLVLAAFAVGIDIEVSGSP